MRLPNSPFEYNYLDSLTGETVTYAKVTTWADGSAMTDSQADGVVYVKIGNEYFKRVLPNNGRVNVLSLGLKNDGVFRNEVVFNNAIRRLPKNTTFYFPAGTYLFGPLPTQYDVFGVPCAINTDTSGANLEGESQEQTHLVFTPGCIGIQVSGGFAPGITRLRNFSMSGPGPKAAGDGLVTNNAATINGQPNPDAGRPLGVPGYSFGLYKYNGINAWGQCFIENVNVARFSGHNVCIFGDFNTFMTGIQYELPGVITNNSANGSIHFSPTDPSQSSKVQPGYKVTINGITSRAVGYAATYFDVSIYGADNKTLLGLPTSGAYTATITPSGGALIADNTQICGICNFDYAGGCGLYIVGSDSNQTTMVGCSVRQNGHWGIYDGSFLGSYFYGTHGSANGLSFNEFPPAVPNSILRVGAFKTAYTTAASGWYGVYAEGGNQGKNEWSDATVVIGGTLGDAGYVSTGLVIEGKNATGLNFQNLSLRPNYLRLGRPDRPGTAPLDLRQHNNNAWGFGATVGNVGYPLLQFLYAGDTILSKQQNNPLRKISFTSTQADEMVLGTVRHQTASSLTDMLANALTGETWRPGDVVGILRGSGPTRYCCWQGGTVKQTLAGTGTSSNDTVNVSGNNGVLPGVGEYVSLAGSTYEVTQVGTTSFIVFPQPTTPFSNATLSYASPEFVPDGFGRGPVSQRPAAGLLTASDAGWQWYDPATNTRTTFTGTAWA